MKVVVQRVKSAAVTNDTINNQINKGYCLLVGVGQDSTKQDAEVLAKKIANARLFEDAEDKLNFNIQQIEGEILSISQFTLYADVKKGNRPGFSNSKNPTEANELYEYFNDCLQSFDIPVKTGEFGTHMNVEINNDGPVTIIYESQDGKIQ
ncbi:D-tyrosyl-tRNA(Tyr) deacylase [Staphylococcus simiae]|uniref:D-aminoacyl-tRNA deacylase n=1 Tax=Staphylococcus simiae TaxID=308354 RepID=UPI001A97025B|nr:D-aminoacyl-tRNA deacylase [Staphylococcus simiae]MBO1199778.1 D-tyrosyl-tRNA(Tyr) deacylase [Staphylococcus simiae]MBO1202069.1 D-tyrosyl-tRNA(Tyr) deacylase [Staphylococcus simiae]MBO1204311.1 D-tyrosyl-tRNA(Tyr) deacylase [Staphylococcus simiae]MBO1211820.1 D-tyrosyl-tRNA(Tyr) deacylase [Staphylococcus simiae]MBO1230494.1 D-tyrosyl-tRNA(Tyr) deacylase [Staphylococcus simiae]